MVKFKVFYVFSKGEKFLLVFTSDISERKRAEQDLQESRDHHQSLTERATHFTFYRLVHDQDNPQQIKVVFVSPSVEEIMGLSDPLRFESWFDTMHPDDVERVIDAKWRAFETLNFNESCRFFHPLNNEWRWINAISKAQEIIIFRIFQEALLNIWKHARTTQVTIAMTDDGLSTVFSIKDNGKGFNLKEIKGKDPLINGLGLVAMKEWPLMAGGAMEILSQKGPKFPFLSKGDEPEGNRPKEKKG